jgi:hypothetical protein
MKKGVIIVVILLVIVGIVAAIVLSRGKQPAKPASGEVTTEVAPVEEVVNVPKEEQTGTAGSNIPLKDNVEKAKVEVENALRQKFAEMYGDTLAEVKMNEIKIYDVLDEETVQLELTMDEVAFEASYDLKAKDDATTKELNQLAIPNGELNEETNWVTGKGCLGVLRPNPSGDQPKYIITDFGTGW